MQFTARKAVSPIIATLLLIAIAVAAGIIVYVFTNSISGNLTQQGGQQVSEQVSMDAYSFSTSTAPVIVLRDVGSSNFVVTQVYFDGNLCQVTGSTCTGAVSGDSVNPWFSASGTCTPTGLTTAATVPLTCTPGQYAQMTISVSSQTSGTSHILRIVTADGGTFTFSIIAGRSG